MPKEARWDLESAKQAEDVKAWIVEYLAQPEWANVKLSQIVANHDGEWDGPVLMPLNSLVRCAGPDETFYYQKDPDEWHASIAAMLANNPTKDDFPPVVTFTGPEGQLQLSDGNHRVAALEQTQETHIWAFVCRSSPFKHHNQKRP